MRLYYIIKLSQGVFHRKEKGLILAIGNDLTKIVEEGDAHVLGLSAYKKGIKIGRDDEITTIAKDIILGDNFASYSPASEADISDFLSGYHSERQRMLVPPDARALADGD